MPLRSAWRVRPRPLTTALVGTLALPLLLGAGVWRFAYFDRSDLADIEPFIHSELPTTGWVLDSRGSVLIELAVEYRRMVGYDDLPPILTQAILAAEDRAFFDHAGISYRSVARALQKGVVSSVGAWWTGDADVAEPAYAEPVAVAAHGSVKTE